MPTGFRAFQPNAPAYAGGPARNPVLEEYMRGGGVLGGMVPQGPPPPRGEQIQASALSTLPKPAGAASGRNVMADVMADVMGGLDAGAALKKNGIKADKKRIEKVNSIMSEVMGDDATRAKLAEELAVYNSGVNRRVAAANAPGPDPATMALTGTETGSPTRATSAEEWRAQQQAVKDKVTAANAPRGALAPAAALGMSDAMAANALPSAEDPRMAGNYYSPPGPVVKSALTPPPGYEGDPGYVPPGESSSAAYALPYENEGALAPAAGLPPGTTPGALAGLTPPIKPTPPAPPPGAVPGQTAGAVAPTVEPGTEPGTLAGGAQKVTQQGGIIAALLKQPGSAATEMDGTDKAMALLSAGFAALAAKPQFGNPLAWAGQAGLAGVKSLVASKASKAKSAQTNFKNRLGIAKLYTDLTMAKATLQVSADDKRLTREQRKENQSSLIEVKQAIVDLKREGLKITRDKNQIALDIKSVDVLQKIQTDADELFFGADTDPERMKAKLSYIRDRVDDEIIGALQGSSGALAAYERRYREKRRQLKGSPKALKTLEKRYRAWVKKHHPDSI